jgi:hypothetical protein
MKILKDKLSHDDYYQNTEYVSNSMLNNLSGNSPEYFRFRLDNPQLATPAMKFGSALHVNVLQPSEFNKNYAVAPKFDKRTKVGKADYAEFQKKNFFKTVITEAEFELIEQMTMKLMKDSAIKQLLSGGEKEKIITWHNETHDVECKGMLDCYKPKPNIIIDLKTTQDASYNGFRRSILKYKYHKQAAFYMDAVEADEFYIVAIEKSPPFNMNVFQIGDDMLDDGRYMYNQELEIYNYCMKNDYWPGQGYDYLNKNSERNIHIMTNDI